MGTDLFFLEREHRRRRGAYYEQFKKDICELLGMPCRFDVNGPGDDHCPSDAEVLSELRRRIKREEQ